MSSLFFDVCELQRHVLAVKNHEYVQEFGLIEQVEKFVHL